MTADATVSEPFDLSRNRALDGLRGIAAVGIAVAHAYPTYTFWVLWSFVDLFFVLSGYLIGSILLNGKINVVNFWVRRALRIWPVYYATLAVSLALSYARVSAKPELPEPTGLVQSLFFVQFVELYGLTDAEALEQTRNYLLWFGHSWSLAVEEQFYVLLPLVLLALRRSSGLVLAFAGAAIAAAVLYRATGPSLGLLASRVDGLMLGVALAVLLGAGVRWQHLRLLLLGSTLAGLTLAVPYVLDGYLQRIPGGSWPSDPFTVLGFALVYFALVGWLAAEPATRIAGLLGSRWLVYLGSISYAVYMFHLPIQGLVHMYDFDAHISELPVGVHLAMWALLFGCAHLSKQLIENRFNALKSRFPLHRGAPAGAPSIGPLPSGTQTARAAHAARSLLAVDASRGPPPGG